MRVVPNYVPLMPDRPHQQFDGQRTDESGRNENFSPLPAVGPDRTTRHSTVGHGSLYGHSDAVPILIVAANVLHDHTLPVRPIVAPSIPYTQGIANPFAPQLAR